MTVESDRNRVLIGTLAIANVWGGRAFSHELTKYPISHTADSSLLVSLLHLLPGVCGAALKDCVKQK